MPLSRSARFNLALFAWSLAILLAGGIGLWALDRTGRLPPPPLTATNCIDEKFKFVHESPVRAPRLIAVGSSATWRNVDFSVLARHSIGADSILNLAPCYLKLHQIAYLTRFYLDNLPSAKVVLSVFAMRDFEDCSGDPAFFDPVAAHRYVIDRKSIWHLYFQNFRPRSFFDDVRHIRDLRSGADVRFTMVMDRFGSSPLFLRPPEIRENIFPTQDCFEQLERMAHDLDLRGITWVVVLMPTMRAWIKAYDPGASRDSAWRDAVKARLRGTSAVLLDGNDGPPVQDRDFTDPSHLHWDSVPRFNLWIFDKLARQGILATIGEEVQGAL